MNRSLVFCLRRALRQSANLQRLAATSKGKGTVQGEMFDLGQLARALKSRNRAANITGEVRNIDFRFSSSSV